jgi:hypothetical protein
VAQLLRNSSSSSSSSSSSRCLSLWTARLYLLLVGSCLRCLLFSSSNSSSHPCRLPAVAHGSCQLLLQLNMQNECPVTLSLQCALMLQCMSLLQP